MVYWPVCRSGDAGAGPEHVKFHDAPDVYQPAAANSQPVEGRRVQPAMLNDMVSDLISAKPGISFMNPDSYLFMAKSFDPNIAPGAALSPRALKTKPSRWATTSGTAFAPPGAWCAMHGNTEFELVFNDPATTGYPACAKPSAVAGTCSPTAAISTTGIPVIARGHLPVAGLARHLGHDVRSRPGKVYRHRTISYRLTRLYITTMLITWAAASGMDAVFDLDFLSRSAGTLMAHLFGAWLFLTFGTRKLTNRFRQMIRMVRTIAEGGAIAPAAGPQHRPHRRTHRHGAMVQQLYRQPRRHRAPGDPHLNELSTTNQVMQRGHQDTRDTTHSVLGLMDDMFASLAGQMREIDAANLSAVEMKRLMQEMMEAASQQSVAGAPALARHPRLGGRIQPHADPAGNQHGRNRPRGGVISEIADQTNLWR